MSNPGPVAQAFGRLAYEFSQVQPLLPTYLHLLVSSIFPIFAGAHASLARPTSAASPDKRLKKKNASAAEDEDSDSDDEDEEEQRMEGLSPSDALLFPLFAGATLAGLYFLIKWLGDPVLLNKILNYYFAIFGVFSVTRLVTDLLDVSHSILFPKRYVDSGIVFHVHYDKREAAPISSTANPGQIRYSPLPGVFSRLPLPAALLNKLWTFAALPHRKLTVRAHLHRLPSVKLRVGIHNICGFICGLSVVLYFNLVAKPWFLTNLLGFGFAYGTLQFLSPTTFATGSLVLGALFFYDIYFVFFTPMMVTVAQSLDIPIKLVFPRPPVTEAGASRSSHAMLGLGDVVLPGMMIGHALRFDYYLFYLRKQVLRKVPITKTNPSDDSEEMVEELTKPKYISLIGRWGEHLWTHSWLGKPLFSTAPNNPQPHTTFPKPYFYASIVGYLIGMLTTLAVMQVWGHAQPALLYLVPGVLISLWGTALARGELNTMWEFSEAMEEEEEQSADKDDKNGSGKQKKQTTKNQSFFSAEKQERAADKLIGRYIDHKSGKRSEEGDTQDTKSYRGNSSRRPTHELFFFSIEAPTALRKNKPSHNSVRTPTPPPTQSIKHDEKPLWVSPNQVRTDDGHAKKRLRVRQE